MGILGGNHTSPASAGNAATAAQSAKAHPANGIRPESAQPRPHARPPPAHDGIPVKARAPPPFWREFFGLEKGVFDIGLFKESDILSQHGTTLLGDHSYIVALRFRRQSNADLPVWAGYE